jgi:hypothetical protein
MKNRKWKTKMKIQNGKCKAANMWWLIGSEVACKYRGKAKYVGF